MIVGPQKAFANGYSKTLQQSGTLGRYRFFDMSISSQLALPELHSCRGIKPVATVRSMLAGQVDMSQFETRHDWRNDRGQLICRCARREADYLLCLPSQANFLIEASGMIGYTAEPDVGQGLLRQLLLNQVLPRYLSHLGELVLHASAVTLPNGSTVAFLGESGSGKSTLASYCQLQGAQIIDDDCILLRTHEGETRVTGGAPTLRLYPDSLRALGHNAADFAPYADGSSKLQMRLTHNSQSQQLTAVFLLNTPLTESSGKAVSIQPAAGQVAMMSMLNSVFSLDPSDTGTQADTFRRVAQTLGAGLPVYNLHYPREHTALPQVLHALQRVGAADLHRQATDLSIC